MTIKTKREFTNFNKRFQISYKNNNQFERKGQAWLNLLSKEDAYLAQLIIGSKYDPFYTDSNIEWCIDFINNLLED